MAEKLHPRGTTYWVKRCPSKKRKMSSYRGELFSRKAKGPHHAINSGPLVLHVGEKVHN